MSKEIVHKFVHWMGSHTSSCIGWDQVINWYVAVYKGSSSGDGTDISHTEAPV